MIIFAMCLLTVLSTSKNKKREKYICGRSFFFSVESDNIYSRKSDFWGGDKQNPTFSIGYVYFILRRLSDLREPFPKNVETHHYL